MAKEAALALINPYSLSKSRTGGIIARIVTRTGLDLVAARMYAPSRELVDEYEQFTRHDESIGASERQLLGDYIAQAYRPDEATGKHRRVLLLVFEGEDAVEKVKKATGSISFSDESGETVRQTYGDYVVDPEGTVKYFEPAIMIGASKASAGSTLKLWAKYADTDGGIVENAADVPTGEGVHKTLVMIKPDNFRFPSARPGNIIDIFSASGLRIIGAKVHRMSVAQAETFYGPVRDVLRTKLKGMVADRAAEALKREFGLREIPEAVQVSLGDEIGPLFGDDQFFEIVRFMTGRSPADCKNGEKEAPGTERTLVLVYQGVNAVDKIRNILGPTDPSKAKPGSVRKEYGQDIMINAAHASDSPENAKREMGIINLEENLITGWVNEYYN